MRTAQRDQSGPTTFGADVNDAASGAGVAHPGAVPFTYTRTATGVYRYRVDASLAPLYVTATGYGGTSHTATTMPAGAGAWDVIVSANNTPVNSRHTWTCTARKAGA